MLEFLYAFNPDFTNIEPQQFYPFFKFNVRLEDEHYMIKTISIT